MSFDLFAPFRWIRDACRILRIQETPPDARSLFRCWLGLQLGSLWRSDVDGPAQARLGGTVLNAPNWGELEYLVEELFARQEYWMTFDRPDPVIVDCGGNIGFAILYFKMLYPQARITSFEPNPNSFAVLQKNVADNRLENVTPIQAACGKTNGSLTFFVNPTFSGRSSQFSDRDENTVPLEVKLVRLSEHLPPQVDLLKMDVEGAEWDVLEDLKSSGKLATIKRFIFEYHHRIGESPDKLSLFLRDLEAAGFTYVLDVIMPHHRKYGSCFQDVMIYARHRSVPPAKVPPGFEQPTPGVSWADLATLRKLPDAVPSGSAVAQAWKDLLSLPCPAPNAPGSVRIGTCRLETVRHDTLVHDFKETFILKSCFADLGTLMPVIVDCGAGDGVATAYFKLWHPQAKIMAFEAHPARRACLEKNIQANRLEQVTVFPGPAGRAASQGRVSDHISGPVDVLRIDGGELILEVLAELQAAGKLKLIRRMMLRYPHREGATESRLSGLLEKLEQAGLTYDVHAVLPPKLRFTDLAQTVWIYASPAGR